MTKNCDEDYDLKELIYYRFGPNSPQDIISKRLTGIGGSEISNQSPKEIFDNYRVEQRHKNELENLISEARKRSEAKKDKNNEQPTVSKASEKSQTVKSSHDPINESKSSLAKTSSLISISQGS